MGNRITNIKNYTKEEYLDKSLKMSNGLTSVFISVLSLSASYLAKTKKEIDFAIWIASCDQDIIGVGNVGFDVNEMPWSFENFEAEKQFILAIIDSAKSKCNWHVLDYEPHSDWVLGALNQFRKLIEDFSKELIGDCSSKNQTYKPGKIEKCPVHNIYLHWAGCVICND